MVMKAHIWKTFADIAITYSINQAILPQCTNDIWLFGNWKSSHICKHSAHTRKCYERCELASKSQFPHLLQLFKAIQQSSTAATYMKRIFRFSSTHVHYFCFGLQQVLHYTVNVIRKECFLLLLSALFSLFLNILFHICWYVYKAIWYNEV